MSQDGWPKFLLRMPKDLKAFVATQAEKNASSLNSEIIRALRERQDREASSLLVAGKP